MVMIDSPMIPFSVMSFSSRGNFKLGWDSLQCNSGRLCSAHKAFSIKILEVAIKWLSYSFQFSGVKLWIV